MTLLLASILHAAEITVFTATPAAVAIDGQVVDYEEGSLLLVARNLKAGRHTVKVSTVAGKPVTELSVTIAQTERVDLTYGERTLTQVGAGLVGEPAVTASYAPIAGYGSHAGRDAGGRDPGGRGEGRRGGSSSPPATTVVVVAPAPAPPPPPKAEPPRPEPVQVVFSLKNSFDMSNIYVDGKRVTEFRTGDLEKTVTLMSGPHTVEIREFTEFATWFKGTLMVTPGEPLRFGYGQDEGVEIYNRPPGAWTPKP